MKERRHTSVHARTLRRDATDVERKIWEAVRDRRLGGWKFRRQATIAPFIVDFLCVEAGLIVELDGGQHHPDVDSARTAYLDDRGYRVVRFWNSDVTENFDGVLECILAAPQPSPLLGEKDTKA